MEREESSLLKILQATDRSVNAVKGIMYFRTQEAVIKVCGFMVHEHLILKGIYKKRTPKLRLLTLSKYLPIIFRRFPPSVYPHPGFFSLSPDPAHPLQL